MNTKSPKSKTSKILLFLIAHFMFDLLILIFLFFFVLKLKNFDLFLLFQPFSILKSDRYQNHLIFSFQFGFIFLFVIGPLQPCRLS